MPWIFLRNYWQYIALAAIIGFLYIRIQIVESQRDNALQTIADMQQEVIKKNTEVALLNKQGKQAIEAKIAQYDAQINELLEAKSNDQKTIANLRISLSNSLRDKAKYYHDRLSNNVADNSAGENSNTAIARQDEQDTDYKIMYLGAQSYIETLEKAGAICATDYNVCRGYVESEQKRIGITQE